MPQRTPNNDEIEMIQEIVAAKLAGLDGLFDDEISSMLGDLMAREIADDFGLLWPTT